MNDPLILKAQRFTQSQRAQIERLYSLTEDEIAVFLADHRKRAVGRTIGEAVADGVMNAGQAELIRDAVARRTSILIIGRTSAGKTWLQQVLVNQLALAFPQEIVAIIDDHEELHASRDNHEIHLAIDGGPALAAAVARAGHDGAQHVVLGELRHAEVMPEFVSLATSGVQVISTVYCHDSSRLLKDLTPYAGVPEAKRLLQAVGLIVQMETHRVARVTRVDYLATHTA